MSPEVNVLVADSRLDHPDHRPAFGWLNAALDSCAQGERLKLLPMATAGFLRLVPHPQMFLEPTSAEVAHAFLGTLLKDKGVA